MLSFFTGREGRLFVVPGCQFFLVPPFAYVKKILVFPFAFREKFWSPPLAPLWSTEKKTGPLFDHQKYSGPPHKQIPPPSGKKMIVPLLHAEWTSKCSLFKQTFIVDTSLWSFNQILIFAWFPGTVNPEEHRACQKEISKTVCHFVCY